MEFGELDDKRHGSLGLSRKHLTGGVASGRFTIELSAMRDSSNFMAKPTTTDASATASGSSSETSHLLHQAPARSAFDATPAYWFAMFAASAFGTNLGDFCADDLSVGRGLSFTALASLSGLAIWADSKIRMRTEAGYWIAIVVLRAASTNVADVLTHDLAYSYVALSVILALATLIAGYFTRRGVQGAGMPRIDGRYWAAMSIAGVFGTVAGDFASHMVGLYAAAAVLCTLLVAVIAGRNSLAWRSLLAYWAVVLIERCAGTPFGDMLASHRALGLGLPLAMACTGGLLLSGLLGRALSQKMARP